MKSLNLSWRTLACSVLIFGICNPVDSYSFRRSKRSNVNSSPSVVHANHAHAQGNFVGSSGPEIVQPVTSGRWGAQDAMSQNQPRSQFGATQQGVHQSMNQQGVAFHSPSRSSANRSVGRNMRGRMPHERSSM